MYPSDRRYTEEHEWVRVDGDLCTVGVTHFAQEELGEVVFVELPEVGARFGAGDEIGTIESVKAVAEVYTPVGGEVVEVNEALGDDPAAVNQDPHGGGWLVRIRPDAAPDLSALMDAAAYGAFATSGS